MGVNYLEIAKKWDTKNEKNQEKIDKKSIKFMRGLWKTWLIVKGISR